MVYEEALKSAQTAYEGPKGQGQGALAAVKSKPSGRSGGGSDLSAAQARLLEALQHIGETGELTLDLGGGVTMKLVRVPAGEFLMGSPEAEAGRQSYEGPQHRVRITKPFYMCATEVTVGQFQAFVSDSGYTTEAERGISGYARTGGGWEKRADLSWRKPGFAQDASHPVVFVSWNDAVAFCGWLSYRARTEVRLPTEAQWEYACRAGSQGRFWWGESETAAGKYANLADRTAKRRWPDWAIFDTEDGYDRTAPAGHFEPNGFGLYDMQGNVEELCDDWYGEGYYAQSPLDDPRGPASGSDRVSRGGSWWNYPPECRAATRGAADPAGRCDSLGFRVAVAARP